MKVKSDIKQDIEIYLTSNLKITFSETLGTISTSSLGICLFNRKDIPELIDALKYIEKSLTEFDKKLEVLRQL